MGRKLRVFVTIAVAVLSARTSAQSSGSPVAPDPATSKAKAKAKPKAKPVAETAPAAPAVPVTAEPPARQLGAAEWTSMSRAGVTVPLRADGPMATDLVARPPDAKWADVPLPPPPVIAAPKASAAAAAMVAAPAPAPAAAEAAAAQSAQGLGPAVFEPRSAAGAGDAGAAPVEGAPAGGSKEPQVKFGADQTGMMVSVTQDLESDKIRQNWAAAGGTIPAFEGNVGMTMIYKDLSATSGAGVTMSGIGFNFGGRVSILTLTPPKYETRDRNWSAFKIGGGADMGVVAVTINMPYYTILGRTYGGPQSSSMSSFTLVGTLGYMYAFGSFDSPKEWSGNAIGVEWAPSYQSNTMTDQSGNTTTSSSMNATGFAFSFESGSMQSMASKMGKKARMKVRVFLLPPVGDLPFMMTASLGAVWY